MDYIKTKVINTQNSTLLIILLHVTICAAEFIYMYRICMLETLCDVCCCTAYQFWV